MSPERPPLQKRVPGTSEIVGGAPREAVAIVVSPDSPERPTPGAMRVFDVPANRAERLRVGVAATLLSERSATVAPETPPPDLSQTTPDTTISYPPRWQENPSLENVPGSLNRTGLRRAIAAGYAVEHVVTRVPREPRSDLPKAHAVPPPRPEAATAGPRHARQETVGPGRPGSHRRHEAGSRIGRLIGSLRKVGNSFFYRAKH